MTPLQIAASQIGIKESPANSNRVKYNTWYYGRVVYGAAYPWCAVFVAWCFAQAGQAKKIADVENRAYCPSYVEWAKKTKKWTTKPQKNNLVLFDWDRDGVADHIGIVEAVLSNGQIQTIEGNTGNTSQSNGGSVMRRVRSRGDILGYISLTETKPVKLDVDGSFGRDSVAKMQAWLKTPEDGIISGQSTVDKTYLPALKSVEYVGEEGEGSRAISALQRYINNVRGAKLATDGCIGPKTIRALQDMLNAKQKTYELKQNGYFDATTAKAFQTYLNTIK